MHMYICMCMDIRIPVCAHACVHPLQGSLSVLSEAVLLLKTAPQRRGVLSEAVLLLKTAPQRRGVLSEAVLLLKTAPQRRGLLSVAVLLLKTAPLSTAPSMAFLATPKPALCSPPGPGSTHTIAACPFRAPLLGVGLTLQVPAEKTAGGVHLAWHSATGSSPQRRCGRRTQTSPGPTAPRPRPRMGAS